MDAEVKTGCCEKRVLRCWLFRAGERPLEKGHEVENQGGEGCSAEVADTRRQVLSKTLIFLGTLG